MRFMVWHGAVIAAAFVTMRCVDFSEEMIQ